MKQAANFCLNPTSEKNSWPATWNTLHKYKILEKTRIEQLTCAGAFYLAENDRTGNNDCSIFIKLIAEEIESLIENK